MKKTWLFILIMSIAMMTACGSSSSDSEHEEEKIETTVAEVTKTPEQAWKKDLEKLLSATEDAEASMAASFTKAYSGEKVSFNGYVADIDEDADENTGTVLLHSGHYNNPTVHGPDIIFENVSVQEYGISENDDVAVTAVVRTYDSDMHLLYMDLQSLDVLSAAELPDIDFDNSEVAKLVQSRLNEAGYDCGSVDGIVGPNTRGQIAAYRSDRGLSESEAIDSTLLAYMHITPKMIETAMATPTPTVDPVLEEKESSEPISRQYSSGFDNGGGTGGNSNFNLYDNPEQQNTSEQWVLNTHTRKIHRPGCSSVAKIAPQNYSTSSQSIEELKQMGYDPCGNCLKGY